MFSQNVRGPSQGVPHICLSLLGALGRPGGVKIMYFCIFVVTYLKNSPVAGVLRNVVRDPHTQLHEPLPFEQSYSSRRSYGDGEAAIVASLLQCVLCVGRDSLSGLIVA